MYLQISIHLMFLLIFSSDRSTPSSITHFNTSHVSINHRRLPAYLCSRLHFNTSHVSINLKELQQRKRTDGISIHLMFLLIMVGIVGKHQNKFISIHLMFLLILWERICREGIVIISIHLMFLLIHNINNNSILLRDFNTSHVSINRVLHQVCLRILVFQYISCFY